MTRRKSRLGSPPGEHRKEANHGARHMRQAEGWLKSALAQGDCVAAADYLVVVARAGARYEAHHHSLGRESMRRPSKTSVTSKRVFKLTDQFVRRCVK
jgi:hypothetical protein